MSEPRRYEPKLGQAIFGNPTGEYEVSDIGAAAISYLLRDVERVAWNRGRVRNLNFQDEGTAEQWNALGTGVEWHAYCWHEDTPEAERANLTFGGVGVRWYKYPGRGESVDRAMTPDAWAAWLSAALKAVRALEERDDEPPPT